MSDNPETPAGAPAVATPPPRKGLAAALPFLITVVAAVLLSLLVQALLPRPPLTPQAQAPTAPLAPTAAPVASPAPTAPPAATPVDPPAEGTLRLDILDLKEENRQLWSALYLLRAASQLDDAVAALQLNDLDEADRIMLTAYRSLDRAYAVSAEQEKGPIDTFRITLSQIRDDLRLRPEGVDRRLRQLRSLVLSLVDEGA